MGNTEAHESQKTEQLIEKPTYEEYQRNLKVNTSEEDYLPMTWTMRKTLINGRKFQHIAPVKHIEVDVEIKNKKEEVKGSLSKTSLTKSIRSLKYEQRDVNVQPQSKVEDKEIMCEKNDGAQSPIEINVKRSRSSKRNKSTAHGLSGTKSIFTLQMEDKMRNTRLKLYGLDSEEWKEFSFKDNTFNNVNLPVRKADVFAAATLDKHSEYFTSNQQSQVLVNECNQDYDIKHLLRDNCNCDMCTLAYLTDMSPPKSVLSGPRMCIQNSNSLQEILKIESNRDDLNTKKTTVKTKKGTLRFSSTESVKDSVNGDSTNRRIRAEFRKNLNSRFSESQNKDYSMFYTERMYKNNSDDVLEDNGSTQFVNKTTNKTYSHDKNIHKKNKYYTDSHEHRMMKKSPVIKQQSFETKCCFSVQPHRKNQKCACQTNQHYSKMKESQSDSMMWVSALELENNMLSTNMADKGGGDLTKCLLEHSSSVDSQSAVSEETVTVKRTPKVRSGRSSFTQFETTPSSSLATIMSYRQVQQIFQSLVERTQPQRRMKRNITEFKKMEELGLGEVRNRRWYPGDNKTLSIWSGLHATISGIQAQFRRYHKPVTNKAS